MSLFLLLPFLASCQDDELEKGGNDFEIHGRIVTRASRYEDENDSKEKINDWWSLVVYDRKIVKILKRSSSLTSPVTQEEFEFQFPTTFSAGDYVFYSFANISISKVETIAGLSSGTLAEGTTLAASTSAPSDVTKTILDDAVYNITNDFPNATLISSLTNDIPMSGKEIVTVTTPGILEDLELEVIRMLAKVELFFSNKSKKDITLKKFTFNPINKGNITLLPDYTTLEFNNEKDPVLLSSGVTVEDYSTTPTIEFTTTPVLTSLSHPTQFSTGFYMRESLPDPDDYPSKHFLMNMTIQRGTATEELLYTITSVDSDGGEVTGINRNDYLQIPIIFTDYVVKMDVDCYPPIGGYPVVITEDKPNEFYCKFATEGVFGIIPSVYDTYTDSYVYYPTSDYEVTSVTGDVSIFSVVPHKDLISGEIIGELNTVTGKTACVNIRVYVDLGGGVKQIYDRRVYIIR